MTVDGFIDEKIIVLLIWVTKSEIISGTDFIV